MTKQDRLERERHTIQVMIKLFCNGNHRTSDALCAECQQLQVYAMQRIDKCPYQRDKPTCAKCTIHCYKPTMREHIRQVMRYAGPRMLLSHPLLAVCHYLDGRKRI
ncbi:MAG: nitrous oxide-stimulated promoter family protein [Rubrobacteridae bacterium]|nr:nitrous oxide-stimulated promoter family protein [Rubrobacteridae bacterium]